MTLNTIIVRELDAAARSIAALVALPCRQVLPRVAAAIMFGPNSSKAESNDVSSKPGRDSREL
jgi:hypothetical protein